MVPTYKLVQIFVSQLVKLVWGDLGILCHSFKPRNELSLLLVRKAVKIVEHRD